MTIKKTDNQGMGSAQDTRAYPESEDLWNEIWDQLPVAPDAKKDDHWQKPVDEIKKEDPQKTIEGHRFQGQGQ